MKLTKGSVFASVLGLSVFSFTAEAASKGGTYVGGFYGVATSSSSAMDILDGVGGAAMGGQLGLGMTSSLALEVSGRMTSFDQKSGTVLSIPITSEIGSTVVGVGLRQSFFKYLNVVGGLSYSMINLNIGVDSTNPTLAALKSAEEASGLGYFYGGGLALPLGRIAITAEYLFNVISSDVTSKEITGGLNFYF